MALSLVQVEEIGDLLQQTPRLVDLLEARSAEFAQAVLGWLKRVEKTLEDNRLATVSAVAAQRAMLVQAARGQQAAEIVIAGRVTPRKMRDAAANLALQRCSALLQSLVDERRPVFQDAERVASQIVAVAEAKGLLLDCEATPDHQAHLLCVQRQVAADRDLASVLAHLQALVGRYDLLVFLDRALPR